MATEFSIVDPDAIEPQAFPESGMLHRQLTAALGCTDMRVNAVTLRPGESLAEHAHERQEEVYVSLTGGSVVVDGEPYEVPDGGVVRLGPSCRRYVMNPSADEIHRWLMFGAPPVGSIDDYGEYVVPGKPADDARTST